MQRRRPMHQHYCPKTYFDSTTVEKENFVHAHHTVLYIKSLLVDIFHTRIIHTDNAIIY